MSHSDALELPPSGATDADFESGSVRFVGTATVILRYAGFTILTDPNFLHRGDHVHLGYGITSERRTDPALELDDLPPVDFVLLSHYHGDHFDRETEERLDRDLPVVTTPHAAENLAAAGFRSTHPLETWDEIVVRKGDRELTVTATPATHAPGPASKLLPPVMGSMLEFRGPDGGVPLRLYVTGDTLIYDRLREIADRYPEIDVALLHLGGTRVFGLLLTMDGEQGREAVELFDPETAIPIHYNDYTVFQSPLSDFRREIEDAGLEDRVEYLEHGDSYEFDVPSP